MSGCAHSCLLSSPKNSEAAITAEQFEAAHRVEDTYIEHIEKLIAPLVGDGRVHAQVTVDLDAGFAGTQVMELNDININGNIFTAPSVSGVPLPASFWGGSLLFAGIGTQQLLKRRRRAAV